MSDLESTLRAILGTIFIVSVIVFIAAICWGIAVTDALSGPGKVMCISLILLVTSGTGIAALID